MSKHAFALSSILFLVAACGETASTPTESRSTKELTKAAGAGDEAAMEELETQVVEVAKEVKKDLAKKASKGDEKAQVKSAWLNGGEAKVAELAEAGNSQALYELGKHYNSMIADKQEQGRDMLLKAAEADHQQALFLAGKHCLHGLTGFAKDAVLGRKYLEQAAEAGEAEAAYVLGVALRYGFELAEDKPTALKYYQQAKDGGFKDPGGELESLTKELGL